MGIGEHARPLRVAMVMEGVAGHATHIANLRDAWSRADGVQLATYDVVYRREGGWIERVRERAPYLPAFATGVLRGAWELRTGLTETPGDVVLMNSRTGVLALDRVGRRPTVLDTDVTPKQLDELPGYERGDDRFGLGAVKARLFRAFVAQLAHIVAWSQWARRSFVDDYGADPSKVSVVPPGVDVEIFRPDPAAPSDAGRPVRVLFVGGDFERKNGPAVLKWLADRRPLDCELHVVTRAPIAQVPGLHVHLGLTPKSPELVRLFQASDVFVLPSLGECFGIATLEAMACGAAVIQTRVGGVEDIVTDGDNGLLIPAGDDRALGEALSTLITQPTLRARFRDAGLKKIASAFNHRTNAGRVLDILRAARADRPGAARSSS